MNDTPAVWNAICSDASDNVAVALAELTSAAIVQGAEATQVIDLIDAIPAGHKFAVTFIKAGAPVMKYGQPIGTATVDISAGAHVHVHNVTSNRAQALAPNASR
jgi:altronate dehydratase